MSECQCAHYKLDIWEKARELSMDKSLTLIQVRAALTAWLLPHFPETAEGIVLANWPYLRGYVQFGFPPSTRISK